MKTKVCTKCGIEKPIESYHRDKTKSSGRSSHCNECKNESRKFRDKNPDLVQRSKGRLYNNSREKYLANRDKILQRERQKRLENPQKYRDAVKRWREKHPDIDKQRKREYYWNNVEKERERSNVYHKNNPDKARESRKRWNKNNPDKVKKNASQYAKKKSATRKMMSIEYKGGKCEDCGIIGTMGNRSIFDFHHVEPSNKHNDVNEIQKQSLDKLKQELDKCVLLCSNCHRLRHQHFKDGLRDTL